MRSQIREMGVLDKLGKTHPVYFKAGLNVVTGKSSTGKSALIEIFDYCFGSSEYTVPKGVITNSAAVYYVCIDVDGQHVVLGRAPDGEKKAFFKREDAYVPNRVGPNYFVDSCFLGLDPYKKLVRELFLDIDDVDDSLMAKDIRGRKAPTPSIRSFASFMLQHQNLVANKHALFYRFDEKEKRDQTIDHTKIFIGLVDQKYFLLSQEREQIQDEIHQIRREIERNKRVVDAQTVKVEPVLRQLYAFMGFEQDPIPLDVFLRRPKFAKDRLEEVIRPEKIVPLSSATIQRQISLERTLSIRTGELRRLRREAASIQRHVEESEKFAQIGDKVQRGSVQVATTVCPFCRTEKESLQESALNLKEAISKLSDNLMLAKPMRAKFDISLAKLGREISKKQEEIVSLASQINEIEKAEAAIRDQKNLYESVLQMKSRLDALLDSIDIADEEELLSRIRAAEIQLHNVDRKLAEYNYKDGLAKAESVVNSIMKAIGSKFEFERSYTPINLHFSFETFELYHLAENEEKIYLRSMGSGANWLYSHVTLFLALHEFFATLKDRCAIPSILFFDQPTQVYFPSFRFDKFSEFDVNNIQSLENRALDERAVDEDIKAVENLFSQLSIYCSKLEASIGFCPQIIVTDHADHLQLSDGNDFEVFVNGNRWRTRGLIDPVHGA
jgi:hypothetical protein